MHSAVHISVHFGFVMADRVHDRLRPLGGGGVIQVGQRLFMHAGSKAGEVAAQPFHRERFRDRGETGGGAAHDAQAASLCGSAAAKARLSMAVAIAPASASSMASLIREANALTSIARA